MGVELQVTKEELLRAMDDWGAAGFVVTDRSVDFLNYFLREREEAFHWRQANAQVQSQCTSVSCACANSNDKENP